MQIKSRFDDRILYECESETMLETLQQAVKGGANLHGAYLDGANLDGANLGGANLGGANLDGAYLDGAYLDGANLGGANLGGANLDGAYLCVANLRGANLCVANLRGANLRGANLCVANLRGANLRGANLDGAYLGGAKINWQSHWLLGEILKRAAGDDVGKRCLAGGIAISTEWCWNKMLQIDHPEKAWALSVFLPLIQDGDNAPDILRAMLPAKAVTT